MHTAQIITNAAEMPQAQGFSPFLADDQQPAGYKVNAGLLKDEHIVLEDAIETAMLDELTFYDAIKGNRTPEYGLGKTVVLRDRKRLAGSANVAMEPEVQPTNASPTFDQVGNYIPIISAGYVMSVRHHAATQAGRSKIDTAKAEGAARAIGEMLETLTLDGRPDIVEGWVNYGLRTHPDRNTQTITTWIGKSGEDIVADVNASLQMLFLDRKKGPFKLFIPKEYVSLLNVDYSDVKGDNTIRERILALPGIGSIEVAWNLDPDEYFLLDLTRETADIVAGQGFRNVQWGASPLTTQFYIYGAEGVRIKSTMDGFSGIVHATT